MRIRPILPRVLIGATTSLAAMLAGPVESADFPWFGGSKKTRSLSVVIEDNVRGGCWKYRAAAVAPISRTLERYGIAVDDGAPVTLVLYAVGHPSASGRYGKRLACVGVLQIRVSALDKAEDRSVEVTNLYEQERLLVSHHLLDRAIGTTALELVDNFSRRYADSGE